VSFWHVIVADYLTSLAKTFGDVQVRVRVRVRVRDRVRVRVRAPHWTYP